MADELVVEESSAAADDKISPSERPRDVDVL
jgi:hypothetical protein